MAEAAGRKSRVVHMLHKWSVDTVFAVPPGVLSVLPGYGKTTGIEIVSNPLIRKVDLTVRDIDHTSDDIGVTGLHRDQQRLGEQ